MPRELKYGHVTLEHSSIPDDEIVVVFRARDAILVPLLANYEVLCATAGSPEHHLALIRSTIDAIQCWQLEHGSRVPTSDSLEPCGGM